MKKGILVVVTAVLAMGVRAQSHSETIKKNVALPAKASQSELVVKNINGNVTLEAYNGKELVFEVEKNINAKSQSKLEQGKSEIGFEIEKEGNTIYAYCDTPYSRFDFEKGHFNHNSSNYKYRFVLDMKIKVPQGVSVDVSTINNGNVVLRNLKADEISANNINGGIDLVNVSGKVSVNALNKDINVSFAQNPTQDSSFKSLNGDINVECNGALDAEVRFKSLNGDLYTNFDASNMAPELEKTSSKGKGFRVKVGSNERYRIGNGGPVLSFDVLNGDVTLKK
ncbi:DUF4097 family beta strand repeat-containing protein [Sediminicola luteus]|uniref:DUF4097 domain-containing protein n=1 Tax=Sediminicola luteus TaxID=319238 RepID=A0A2A4G705_9FLAO|nr:hypothetical protein B7P33_07875 [Sediminicola luteus]